MGLRDFIERFNTLFYSATSVGSLGWEDEEICEFLNTAQMLIVEETIAVGNFEAISEIISSNFYSIYKTDGPTDGLIQGLNSYTKELSNSILFVISGMISYKENALTKISALDKVPVSEISHLLSDVTIFRNPKMVINKQDTNLSVTIYLDSIKKALRKLLTTYYIDINLKVVNKPEDFRVDSGNSGNSGTYTNLNPLLYERIISGAVEIAAKTMLTQQQSTQ